MAAYHGTPGNDVLIGTAEDDTFIGHGGNDRFEGRGGNDVYFVDDNGDTVVEFTHHGYDTIYAASHYALGPNSFVEVLSTARHDAVTPINLTGNYLDQLIMGNAGANILHGGGGAGDRLAGFAGDDIYFVDFATVQVFEEAADGSYLRGGNDALYASVSYVLPAAAEIELLSVNSHAATTPINLTGSAFGQTLVGNAGANVLNGGGGIDRLYGREGDDLYHVDVAGDQVFEHDGQGNDAVHASASFTLSQESYVEILSTNNHAATDPINLTGNKLDNIVQGNAGANILHGGGGVDQLYGFGGNDIYYTDVAETRVFEGDNGGNDVVYASVSYTLGAPGALVQVETLSTNSYAGTAAINLTGNSWFNKIVGNEGPNVLDGGGANDTLHGLGGDDTLLGGADDDLLFGGAGNDMLDGGTQTTTLTGDRLYGGTGDDILIVDSMYDVVIDRAGEGFDTVLVRDASGGYRLPAGAEIELLAAYDPTSTVQTFELYGNELANEIRGNSRGTFISGGGGDDVLDGLAGSDTLLGGPGADIFAFTTALFSNVDRLDDFAPGIDRIALDDAVFVGLAPGPLPASAFRNGAAAQDSDDRIIYGSAGRLYFDPDGVGGADQVQFATLVGSPSPSLAASDFVVI